VLTKENENNNIIVIQVILKSQLDQVVLKQVNHSQILILP